MTIGCDGGSDCVEIADNGDFLSQFEDCPTDGLAQVYNGFGCTGTDSNIRPRKCEIIDCITMECSPKSDPDTVGLFTIDELTNVSFSGLVSLDGGDEVAFECIAHVP